MSNLIGYKDLPFEILKIIGFDTTLKRKNNEIYA